MILAGICFIYAIILAFALFFADQFWILKVAARTLTLLGAPTIVFLMFTGTKETEKNSDK
ncbi:hypothetical protein KDAU_09840 [Dictyobacter aurantiacus]|uniref:Uncharacterized protein n=1 Tax=Dictyobacter aurantiacus TaxID=1936993 RepID=A0A401Z9X6_9CHLR|nr:hypothetical protein KDAU_09840 [Dictyobacter aurantiacus]